MRARVQLTGRVGDRQFVAGRHEITFDPVQLSQYVQDPTRGFERSSSGSRAVAASLLLELGGPDLLRPTRPAFRRLLVRVSCRLHDFLHTKQSLRFLK